MREFGKTEDCPITKTISINAYNAYQSSVSAITQSFCNSHSNYSILVNPTGGSFVGTPGVSSNGFIHPSLSQNGINTFTYVPSHTCIAASSGSYLVEGSLLTTTGATSICEQQSTTLLVSGADSYTWQPLNVQNASITITPSVSGVYTVMGTSTLNGCSNQKTVNVQVFLIPTIAISGSTALCSGDSIILTASGAATYTWNNGSNSHSISVSPTIKTSYSLTGSSIPLCENTTSVMVNVFNSPRVYVTGETSICKEMKSV